MEQRWSPNQLQKREILISAAAEVIIREGIEACTARAIADASPLSTSSLHYYFSEVDEIIDLAFRGIFEHIIERIREQAQQADNPVDALWGAITEYFHRGSIEGHRPHTPMLWFEYQLVSMRRNETETMSEIAGEIMGLFHQLIEATNIDDAGAKSEVLFVAALGYTAISPLHKIDLEDTLDRLATVLGLPRNRAVGSSNRTKRKKRA